MKIEVLPDFEKDLLRLKRKYTSLADDLPILEKVLEIMPWERPPFSLRLDEGENGSRVIEIRKVACKSLRGRGVNSGLRLVYTFLEDEERIILMGLYDSGDRRTSSGTIAKRKLK